MPAAKPKSLAVTLLVPAAALPLMKLVRPKAAPHALQR